MTNKLSKTKRSNFLIFAFTLSFLSSCETKEMSVFYEDKNAGFNGSFETVKDNLPVNWLLYTAQTVPSGDFEIKIDNKDFNDGGQSLHFAVKTCASTGGWHSPGLSKELPAKPGDVYKISFWLKNNGSEFVVKVGGISELAGKLEVIIQSKEQIDNWKMFEYTYTIPEKMNALRLEMNVLQPGDFKIDNVNIEKDK